MRTKWWAMCVCDVDLAVRFFFRVCIETYTNERKLSNYMNVKHLTDWNVSENWLCGALFLSFSVWVCAYRKQLVIKQRKLPTSIKLWVAWAQRKTENEKQIQMKQSEATVYIHDASMHIEQNVERWGIKNKNSLSFSFAPSLHSFRLNFLVFLLFFFLYFEDAHQKDAIIMVQWYV